MWDKCYFVDHGCTNHSNLEMERKSDEKSGVSVQFLMVGGTNSMIGYHLIAEGHSYG